MSNTFFRFKQFIIHQDKCAMKVCTDSCLFGAWIANMIILKKLAASTILDAGSGTGLLSLMLAQKSDADINAIEINKASFGQSMQNIESSTFNKRIQLFYGDMFTFQFPRKYDLIVCNPPFFIDQLKSEDKNKSSAMHNSSESFAKLFSFAKKNLTPGGNFAILISYKDLDKTILWADECSLYPVYISYIQHSPTHAFSRVFILFGQTKLTPAIEYLSIHNREGGYEEYFKKLLTDYYL